MQGMALITLSTTTTWLNVKCECPGPLDYILGSICNHKAFSFSCFIMVIYAYPFFYITYLVEQL
jgi:hypothetical protein